MRRLRALNDVAANVQFGFHSYTRDMCIYLDRIRQSLDLKPEYEESTENEDWSRIRLSPNPRSLPSHHRFDPTAYSIPIKMCPMDPFFFVFVVDVFRLFGLPPHPGCKPNLELF